MLKTDHYDNLNNNLGTKNNQQNSDRNTQKARETTPIHGKRGNNRENSKDKRDNDKQIKEYNYQEYLKEPYKEYNSGTRKVNTKLVKQRVDRNEKQQAGGQNFLSY